MDASTPAPRNSGQTDHFQRLLAGSCDDCLRGAWDGLRRALGDGREEHGAALDPDRLGRQVAALHAWAEQADLLIPEDELPPIVKGGREHSLLQTRRYLSRIIKITIGPEFGFYAACFPRSQYRDVCNWFTTIEATPQQYFQRLLLLNELFPRCHTRLAGFVWSGRRLHAVTAQLIAQGRPASLNEISQWMHERGFRFISAWTWFNPQSGIALFDVFEKNVMLCDDGEIVPFDVIPVRCEGVFLDMMHAAVARMAETSPPP